MHRRVLGAVALLVLVMPATVATPTDDTPPRQDSLWLATPGPFATLPNFSADPPQLSVPMGVPPAPIQAGSGEIVWKWVLPRLPAEWQVPADTTFTVELLFAGLDRVVPVVDVESEAARVGRFEVRVDVLHWSSDEGIASGYRYMAPELPGGDNRRPLTVEATTREPVRYGASPGDAPLFGIKVTLTGFGKNDDPPLLVVGHREHPARVHAPGFPVEALREWLEADAAAASCNQRVLQQLPCKDAEDASMDDEAPPDVVVPTSNGSIQEAPALPVWVLLLASLLLATRGRRSG